MNTTMTERLVSIAQAAHKAGHGSKEAIYRAACEELCMSRSTLIKKLGEVSGKKPRKKRSDAGNSALTREEATLISGVLMEATRNTGKRLYSLEQAVNDLRSNGLINAGHIDTETGEFSPLSIDAISRALRQYKLHPEQLKMPAPSLQLASLHPNHVWELDASICVLYYLKNPNKNNGVDSGLRMMPVAEFNKNKPKNLARIINDRVWSFELTDHTSGWIYVEYLFGGETSQNFTSVLINAMQDRGDADVLHGVPQILFTDPGSALTAPTLRNLCKALGIQMIQHKARNARATGSVEKARDIIERNFESGLRFRQVDDIDELNRLARLWRMKFNRSAIHSRHGQTRTDCWLKITAEQLVKAPAINICRELAISTPESRKVQATLRVSFRGREYDVSTVPSVSVGDSIMITRNPWRDEEAQVVITGEDGFEAFHLVNEVTKDEYGFAIGAPVIGSEFQAIPQTIAQRNLAEVEQKIMGTNNTAETEIARKLKTLPLNGRFDPYLDIERNDAPTYMPKRGQASTVHSPRIEQLMNPVDVVKILRERFQLHGKTWRGEFYQQIVKRFPNGVPTDQIDELVDEFIGKSTTVVCNIVNGN
ncbi:MULTISPECIES: DDE-type integrase/transposase/recombinase [Photorhabdus]|uniref:DDE-type integrase/transposase/recombinase n=1 Tax=Photorhabdus TaxID=29487 RepID=UPI000CF92B0B|nr:DDE-type integrase/transposase/recombinase [Photorhabdus laumondii]PQQ29546.1 integrase [Photorhabdus luminescens]PQQ31138.1 integrase [Photorhabdus luminescens]